MNRREFLATLGAGSLLAGCLTDTPTAGGEAGTGGNGTATPPTGAAADATPTPAGDGTPTPDPTSNVDPENTAGLAEYGIPATICEEEINPDSGIYAITDPVFDADWSGIGIDQTYRYDHGVSGLTDDQTVIGLTAGGDARAYPLTVLNVHEVVNDTLGGPVMVTFCPICRSGVVADRRLDGEATLFAVTGLLWKPERVQSVASENSNRTFGASASGGRAVSVRHNGNLVMYDGATRSYWSQILARAICGPLTGSELRIRPSTVATWAAWRREHPDTGVLLPPPHSETVDPGEMLDE